MTENLYRDETFVERCFCEAPTNATCASCGRPRCTLHLERELCNRCTQALERSLRSRGSRAWTIGGAAGVIATLALAPITAAGAIFLAMPVAVVAGLGYWRLARALTIRSLGRRIPSVGELPPEPREPDFGDYRLGGPNNYPPGGAT